MLYNEKGEVVEGAMTKEEVTTALTDKETALTTTQKELDEFKATGQGKSIAALREARDAALKDLDAFKTNAASELGKMKTDMESKQLDETFTKISEGDADLAKSIKENYESIVKDTDTPEQRAKKMGDAYRLAVGTSASPEVSRNFFSGAGAPPKMNETTGNWPQPLVELAGRLGLTPEDLKNKQYNGRK